MTNEQITIRALELQITGLKWKMERLKIQLENYRKLQSEINEYGFLKEELNPLVQRLWMLDNSYGSEGLNQKDTEERDEIIEKIAYSVANHIIE